MAEKVTLGQIKQYAYDAKSRLWRIARDYDRDVKIYLHWSAGRYDQTFSDYHINITGDGTMYAMTNDFSEILAHTWRRNSGSVAISLCCGYNCTSNQLNSYPPTPNQIEFMAQVGAILADALDLTIDKKRVMTHGEAADNEDGLYIHPMYGPKSTCERWDLEYLGTDESPSFNPYATDGSRGGDVLRGKMNYYRDQKLSSKV